MSLFSSEREREIVMPPRRAVMLCPLVSFVLLFVSSSISQLQKAQKASSCAICVWFNLTPSHFSSVIVVVDATATVCLIIH